MSNEENIVDMNNFPMGQFMRGVERELREIHKVKPDLDQGMFLFAAMSAAEALGYNGSLPKRWGLMMWDGPTLAESTPMKEPSQED